MREATLAFSGDMNAGKRIVKKAEILLEESLPILHKLMTNKEASSGTIIEIVKQLSSLAGKSGREGAGGAFAPGGGFNVSIEIHALEGKGVTIDGKCAPVLDSDR
jgi:hypothetical protein